MGGRDLDESGLARFGHKSNETSIQLTSSKSKSFP